MISYLKAWRPPLEYYARRRHHPSLAHPSRRPSLPALLEERMTPEGHLALVRPELVMRHSSPGPRPRSCACRACHLTPPAHPAHSRASHWSNGPASKPVGLNGWDDESDEEMMESRTESDETHSEEEEEDDDDGYWSEPEPIEAVTPTSSPSPYFLQPLFLTKPAGC